MLSSGPKEPLIMCLLSCYLLYLAAFDTSGMVIAKTRRCLSWNWGTSGTEYLKQYILLETFAEPSLQATQMKLKRARLADDLNEKIAQRPGPMELVEKNILPVDSSVKEAIIGK